jgi:hypothetical protein
MPHLWALGGIYQQARHVHWDILDANVFLLPTYLLTSSPSRARRESSTPDLARSGHRRRDVSMQWRASAPATQAPNKSPLTFARDAK